MFNSLKSHCFIHFKGLTIQTSKAPICGCQNIFRTVFNTCAIDVFNGEKRNTFNYLIKHLSNIKRIIIKLYGISHLKCEIANYNNVETSFEIVRIALSFQTHTEYFCWKQEKSVGGSKRQSEMLYVQYRFLF